MLVRYLPPHHNTRPFVGEIHFPINPHPPHPLFVSKHVLIWAKGRVALFGHVLFFVGRFTLYMGLLYSLCAISSVNLPSLFALSGTDRFSSLKRSNCPSFLLSSSRLFRIQLCISACIMTSLFSSFSPFSICIIFCLSKSVPSLFSLAFV